MGQGGGGTMLHQSGKEAYNNQAGSKEKFLKAKVQQKHSQSLYLSCADAEIVNLIVYCISH